MKPDAQFLREAGLWLKWKPATHASRTGVDVTIASRTATRRFEARPGRHIKLKGARMNITTHRARIVGSLCYLARTGRLQNIPLGPCLVEDLGGQTVEIIWGPQGQRSAELGAAVFTAAQAQGNLVLLD